MHYPICGCGSHLGFGALLWKLFKNQGHSTVGLTLYTFFASSIELHYTFIPIQAHAAVRCFLVPHKAVMSAIFSCFGDSLLEPEDRGLIGLALLLPTKSSLLAKILR